MKMTIKVARVERDEAHGHGFIGIPDKPDWDPE
jgi:hypothetical protein